MSRVFTKYSVTDNIRQHLQLSVTYCSCLMKTRSAFKPTERSLRNLVLMLRHFILRKIYGPTQNPDGTWGIKQMRS